jgi:endo-1,4-beta-xylanase
MTASAQTIYGNGSGTHNGYYYALYSTGGSANMTLGSGSNYALSFSGVNDVVGGTGWNPGGYRTVGYNVGAASGYNCISVYGWTTNPLIEYYIVEFGSNAAGTYKGSVSSDGHNYSTYLHTQYNQPSIQGTATFNQYLDNWGGAGTGSNRSVTTGNHFNHWKNLGMNLGNFQMMYLAGEAWGGRSGYINATVW